MYLAQNEVLSKLNMLFCLLRSLNIIAQYSKLPNNNISIW